MAYGFRPFELSLEDKTFMRLKLLFSSIFRGRPMNGVFIKEGGEPLAIDNSSVTG